MSLEVSATCRPEANHEHTGNPSIPAGDGAQPMTAWHVEQNLRALALAEERGSWHAVGRMLEGPVFAMIRPVADEQTLFLIAACEGRLDKARAYEEIHGKASLLKADHWFNDRAPARRRRAATKG